MSQRIPNFLTTGTANLKASGAELKHPAALIGGSPFSAQLSRVMDKGGTVGGTPGTSTGAGGIAGDAKVYASLDLPALLSLLLGKTQTTSGQTDQETSSQSPQTASGQAAQATSPPAALQVDRAALGGTPGTSTGAGGIAEDAKAYASLDLPALLSFLLEKTQTASGQTDQEISSQTPQIASWQAAQARSGRMPVRTGSGTAAPSTNGAAGAGQTQDEKKTDNAGVKPVQQLQDLVVGVLALAMLKDAGAGAEAAAAVSLDTGEQKAVGDDGDASVGNGADRGETGPTGDRQTSSAGAGPSSGASFTNDQGLLGSLAFLLFSGVEAAIGGQGGQGAESSGQTAGAAANNGGRQRQAAAAQLEATGPPAQSGDDRGQAGTAQAGGEQQTLAARLSDAAKDADGASSGAATAIRAEAALTPAGETSPGDQSLTMRVFAGAGSAGWTGAERLAGSSAQNGGTATANNAGVGHADGASAIIADLTPLLQGPDRGKPADAAAGKESSDGRESWPVALDGLASTTDGPGAEQQASLQPDPTGAIERFDRVMEQVGGGTGAHDLTVRLTVGNEGSLVLGLKDLGSSVTVEVKASNQGMIDLLQSQREVIVSRLEGRDINADLIIDPNASGTPEKRDKRETGQGTSGPRKQTDGGFRTFLETIV